MLVKKFTYLGLFLVLSPVIMCGQSVTNPRSEVALNFGISNTLLTDEYVSPNEYSGAAQYFGFLWGDLNNSRRVQIDISVYKSSSLKNHLSRANNTTFTFHYRHEFVVNETSLNAKHFSLFLGPGFTIHYSDRTQKFVPIQSDFGVGSLDFNARIQKTLSRKFSLSSHVWAAAVSYANKSKTPAMEQVNNGYKVLTVLALQNFEFDLGARYQLSRLFYTQMTYSLDYLSTSKWDYYRRIEDRFLLQLGIHF